MLLKKKKENSFDNYFFHKNATIFVLIESLIIDFFKLIIELITDSHKISIKK